MRKYIFFLLVLISLSTCTNSLKTEFLSEVQPFPTLDNASYDRPINLLRNCRDIPSYTPDTAMLSATPVKYIRVNFHIMRRGDGSGNFDEELGVKEMKSTLKNANAMLSDNKKMKLPVDNDTPLIPTRYRLKLTPNTNDPNDDGIYFHNDDELYYMIAKGKKRNNYDRKVFDKYGIKKDTVLNIFVMAYHADSLQSTTYRPRVRGIGFGKWCKVTTWYHQACPESQDSCKAKFSPYDIHYKATNLNHEIGHVIGLKHAWGNDGCEDTPRHPNCWGKGPPPCDKEISNNIMDYSSAPRAWSPCQIGTVHYRFSRKKSSIRKLLIPTWCELKVSQTVTIRDTIVWRGAKDLEGHLIIEEDASLTLQCRVSLPPKGKIVVKPGGRLILDGATLENDCGEQWEGIEVMESRTKRGEVFYIKEPVINHAANAPNLTKVEIENSPSKK